MIRNQLVQGIRQLIDKVSIERSQAGEIRVGLALEANEALPPRVRDKKLDNRLYNLGYNAVAGIGLVYLGQSKLAFADRRYQAGRDRDRDIFLGIDDMPLGNWVCVGIGEKRTRQLVARHKARRYECSFSNGFCNALVDRYRREMKRFG